MTSGRYGPALRQIGRLLSGASVASQGTGQLLQRFASNRDEAAFEALIHQHGPMVLGTCRRMLSDPHDVEDAFQATFLVLARRAGSIQDADRLGPWLHGVARRVASRSRAMSARRNGNRRSMEIEPSAEPADLLEASEHRAALDEELASLPEKYRAPLVLCYLEGLTHDEAAARLRWPVGTVRSRLAGGRDRLRARLTRRGLAPASVAPLVLARASIPQALLTTTLRVATSSGTIPAHVATLAQGALTAMIASKLKLVGALGLMTALTVGGAGIAGQQQGDGQGQGKAAEAKPAPRTVEESRDQLDKLGRVNNLASSEKAQATPKPEDDLAKLQGEWKLIKNIPESIDLFGLKDRTFVTIRGKILTISVRGTDFADPPNEIVLGEDAGRKTIDLIEEQEDGNRKISRGIYRIDGNTLEICSGILGDPRPTEFKATASENGRGPSIAIFERKPEVGPADATVQRIGAPNAQATPKTEDDLAKLQGEWKLTRIRPANDDLLDLTFGMTLTFVGKISTTKSRDDKPFSRNVIVLGEEGGRKTIDFRNMQDVADDKTAERGLYRIDGDTLEICSGNPGSPRPTEFKASDDRTYPVICTYMRQPVEGRTNAAIQRLETQLAEQQATIKLLQEQLDGKNLDAPKTDTPLGLAGAPSFYQRYGELEKRREELQFRLKLLEIANRQLSADDNPPLAPEKAEAATESMNAIIKKLEGELVSKTAQIKAFEDEVKKRRKLANPAATQDKPIAEAEEPKAKQPMLMQIGSGWVLSISGELDRVTVLNTETGLRTSHRFPSKLTALLPLYGDGPISFVLKGPEIRQLVVFNFWDAKWYTQDLKEPVKEANSITGNGEVWYELGRFLYIFSAKARKWSILELKSGKVDKLTKFDDQITGKRVYQEGTILHIYNPNTGEWTHTDTNAPDAEAPKAPVENGTGPAPAVAPAANGPAEAKPKPPLPTVVTLSENPIILGVISDERDRAIIFDPKANTRKTYRLPKGVTKVRFERIGGVYTIKMNGPEFHQFALFDPQLDDWTTQDLKEPYRHPDVEFGLGRVQLASVIILHSKINRTIYIYNPIVKKWSTLEVSGDSVPPLHVQGDYATVSDGSVIHIYDARTGVWSRLDTNAPEAEAPKAPVEKDNGPAPAVAPAANPPLARQPVVHTIQGDPDRFLVVSAGLDRLTLIDSKSQERRTLVLPEGITEITPIVNVRRIGFIIKGSKITKVPLYDSQAQNWIEHDLKEPATEVHTLLAPGGIMVGLWLKGPEFSRLEVYNGRKKEWATQDLREPAKGELAPIVTTTTVSYRIGRFLYIYSALADKWAVLELKREDAGMQGMGGGLTTPIVPDNNGKLIIPEDDVVHLYDARTGEWTHIDTKTDK